MRIKAPSYHPDWTAHEILRDFDPRRLQMIGAIALQWNFIEDTLDECLQVVLRIPFGFGIDVTSRINGMDGKTAILQRVIKANIFFLEEEKKLIKATIDAISEHKKYRDGILHARIPSPDADVAFTAPNRGDAYYIIVATEALESVYERLKLIGEEAVGLYRVLDVGSFEDFDLVSEGGSVDPHRLRASKAFQDDLALIREHQSYRLSLPPLPQLVAKPPTPRAKASPE